MDSLSTYRSQFVYIILEHSFRIEAMSLLRTAHESTLQKPLIYAIAATLSGLFQTARGDDTQSFIRLIYYIRCM